MKLIRYFSRELVEGDLNNLNKSITDTEDKIDELKFKIVPLEYRCVDEEFDYWLDVIQKTYGVFGEITTENIVELPTDKQIIIEALTKEKLNNMQKDKAILNLTKELVKVKMDVMNLKKEGIK